MTRLIALVLFLYVPIAHAAPSLLGICHPGFDCDAAYKLYDNQKSLTLSWLEGTFGTRCQCLEKPLNDSRPKVIRAHLIQSPCMRNKRCGRYEALYGYTAASASRAALRPDSRLRKRFAESLERFKKRIEGREKLTCYVSACLECDLNNKARKVLADFVSAALPQCNIVDNPFRWRCLEGTICEQHGDRPRVSKPCIVDLDGTDGSTINVKKWVEAYQHCDLQFYWEPWMNCIRGAFIDPRGRNCRFPTETFKQTREKLCQYFYPLSGTC
jgi:hypothetical protein